MVVLAERNGRAVAKQMENVTAINLRAESNKAVDPNALLITDESNLDPQTDKLFRGHYMVNHSAGQYSRNQDGMAINNNTAESFFALLKRGHYGIFHKQSKQHLFRYCNEFTFRWSHRKLSDSQRRDAAIRGAEGKRLTDK